jgi:hypothetical protein
MELSPVGEDTRYRYLGTIDWYGDTVFNYLQATQFLDEWHRIAAEASSPAESVVIKTVETMAERAANERHLYLKFYGD